jgi:L-lysine exporter family protein LysE/ArgO
MPVDGALASAFQGFALGAGLCCTLGPQSLFVLRQGIGNQSAVAVATICTVVDLMLILLGVAGFGAIAVMLPEFQRIAGWGAAAVALAFGSRCVCGALSASALAPSAAGQAAACRWSAIAMALGISLLNPQVYLEMMAFVGGVAVGYPQAVRMPFVAGVMLASPLWFYGLAYGGRRMARLLRRPGAIRLVDGATAMAMFALAAVLLLEGFGG